ncbi:uncharacterized protein BDZ99DRAFT_457369 [Mytilinidion resinicola]|uniref:Uncharacterized protein n=1 Tax=Mytilinidion resinicola TaxID=574789 RepID=A0A6A6ZBG3_9PEZI|nr:uncharacterized protein BDZ99DRAFT_457369 [Mytilinidion resinicola]KAF2817645.1 hypothetical protein BDZ99DRAFT_457369 [Mytilinidion resinicola]
MGVPFYRLTVPVFVRALTNLSAILKVAEAHAKTNNIDPATLLEARLYPDMGSLPFQIQRCSDSAKFAAVHLAGAENLSMPDTETTFEQLHERIQKTVGFLNATDEKAWEGKETLVVKYRMGPIERSDPGEKYLLEFTLPNFFFHVATAHDILRNQGVPIGKMNYLAGGFM